jgi:hypothetical protein
VNTAIQKLENRLEELHGQIRLNQIEAGRIISELRKSFRHGEWMPYSQKLFFRLKISRKSAERYVDAYQKAKDIGEPIIQEAELEGLNLNRIPVRETLFEVKQEHPKASPSKIVNLTNLKLQQAKEKKNSPPVTSSSAADWIAVVTTLRSKFSGLNQITKQVENGSANLSEVETLVSALRALSEDARQRADRLTEAMNGLQEKVA